MRRLLPCLLLLRVVASPGAPQLDTIDLTIGERTALTVSPAARVSVTDEAVVAARPDAGQVTLEGLAAGRAVLTLHETGGRRTYLVRVASAAPMGRPSLAVRAPGRPASGLSLSCVVDKPRAVPRDVVTYSLACRNLGAVEESPVTIQARLPEGLTMLPTGGTPGGRYDETHRRWTWQLPTLAAAEERQVTFQAQVAVDEPGIMLTTAATAQSPAMELPSVAEPAVVQVVPTPLVAAFALPDVIIAREPGDRPLIDVDTVPGQRIVERLEGLGVVSGYPDGTFRPAAEVTRAEATKMIVAVRQLAGLRDRASITVALSRPATVEIALEDGHRRVVRRLAEGWALPGGQHQILWDGRLDDGSPAGVGVYRYTVTARDEEGLSQSLDGTVHVVTVRPLPTDRRASFIDVPESAWFRPYVAQAEADGIVKGYPGGRFYPERPIKRVENTVMVVRAAGLEDEAARRMNAQLGFTDAAAVPRWAVGYVAVAAEGGLTSDEALLVGYAENTFLPEQTLTRADAAAQLERLLDLGRMTGVTASGSVARGHQVAIAGQPVTTAENGRFRQSLPLRADLERVPIETR